MPASGVIESLTPSIFLGNLLLGPGRPRTQQDEGDMIFQIKPISYRYWNSLKTAWAA
ncbi:MAG: hypothetical protein MUQ20_03065 [Deltaproteobacteria bacterium]|nr:hypothetical protein [Deltaproteobacteria bacterium]